MRPPNPTGKSDGCPFPRRHDENPDRSQPIFRRTRSVCLGSSLFCWPEGTTENSPAFQRWVGHRKVASPEGTTEIESHMPCFCRPFGTCVLCRIFPGVKTPGNSQDVPPGQRNAGLHEPHEFRVRAPIESGGGPPHSKTKARGPKQLELPPGLGVRRPCGALDHPDRLKTAQHAEESKGAFLKWPTTTNFFSIRRAALAARLASRLAANATHTGACR